MAKIRARGAVPVAAAVCDPDEHGYGLRVTLASDGRVLWKLTSRGGSHGYHLVGKLSAEQVITARKDPERFVRFCARSWPRRSGWRPTTPA